MSLLAANLFLSNCLVGVVAQVGGWQQIRGLLAVPDDLELITLYRLGYLPETAAACAAVGRLAGTAQLALTRRGADHGGNANAR